MANLKGAGSGALSGAAIGTMIAPGLGTVIVGAAGALGGLFGLAGDDAPHISNPYEGQERESAYELANGNYGNKAAQNSARAIGRRAQEENESLESNPNFGRNAAVVSGAKAKLGDQAGELTSQAYEHGAEIDTNNKVKSAGMLSEIGKQDMEIDQTNYERDQQHDFQHSFAGGLLKDAIGFEVGGGLKKSMGDGNDGGSDSYTAPKLSEGVGSSSTDPVGDYAKAHGWG